MNSLDNFRKPSRCEPFLARPVAAAPSIHTYFDVVPESPDGSRVVYFEFAGKPLREGRIMVCDPMGRGPTEIFRCEGTPHGAAQQGWLDMDHLYFTADDHVHVAALDGTVVQRFPGAIDTMHPASRRGLAPSKNWRGIRRPPHPSACFRIDIEDGSIHELLTRDKAWSLCQAAMNLDGVAKESMNFKHTKWSPRGDRWFVVFTNEESRVQYPGQPRVKVLIVADADGGGACLLGSFRHHPNWSPDGSLIFAFAGERGEVHAWDRIPGESRVLGTFPDEGHPSMHPNGQFLITDGYPDTESIVYSYCLRTGGVDVLSRTQWPRVSWQQAYPPGRLCHTHPVFSHSGDRIYLNMTTGGLPQLAMLDLTETTGG